MNDSPDKILCSAAQASSMLQISRSAFYSMCSDGRIGPMKISLSNRCARWRVSELREWAELGCPARELWLKMRGAR